MGYGADMLEEALIADAIDRNERGVTVIEDGWAEGYHTTRDGDELRLEDMTDDHLRNTIKFFEKLDTTPLEEELASRG